MHALAVEIQQFFCCRFAVTLKKADGWSPREERETSQTVSCLAVLQIILHMVKPGQQH